jgi:hypothetical protein
MKRLLPLVCLILAVLLLQDYSNFNDQGRPLEISGQPLAQNGVASTSFSGAGLAVECFPLQDAFIVLPFAEKIAFWKRIQVDLKQLQGILSVDVFYREAGREGFSKITRKFVGEGEVQSFTWFIPPGEYSQLRIDFDGCLDRAEPVIAAISLKKFSVFFLYELYLYPFAVVIWGILVLPGSLIYTLVAGEREAGATNNLIYFFTNSLVFYLLLYLVQTIAILLGIPATGTVSLAFLLLLGCLIAALALRGRLPLLLTVLKRERKTYLTSLFLVLVCCLFVTQFSEAPFSPDRVNFRTLGGPTIFSEFSAHDNLFQFINGKAIADGEPFSKYYGEKKLLYKVQDRGILPGVIYSVFRTIFSTFNPYIGGSFLTYTLVGLCMNTMVLFPLIVLFRRYCRPRLQTVFVVLLCLNTFVFPNFYYTWFKFSGAALFISGLLILLDSRRGLGNWVAAGLMFGLSSGMHAGNALAVPLVFLWLIWLVIVECGFWSRQALLFPVALVVTFVLANLPWSIVKALYYPDKHILIYQHYLPGKRGATLAASARNFFEIHPLREQLEFRLNSLMGSLRLEKIVECYQILRDKGVYKFIQGYNNCQFFYFSFSVLPLLLTGAVGRCFSRLLPGPRVETGQPGGQVQTGKGEALSLFAVSLFTVLGLIFAAYTGYSDNNHALPTGTVLIIHTLLLAWILNSGMIGYLLLGTYAVFSAWRLITYSMVYIFF